jgi:2-polyprenyl-6-hydroxyphenyl methylase/3-demethylubiquinone-9 3-methyltransferase
VPLPLVFKPKAIHTHPVQKNQRDLLVAAQKGTIDEKEISHFAKDSSAWWDENGPFKPLHRLNPVRMGYLRRQICRHKNIDNNSLKPFSGLSVLDIGCGGGLTCEPMARMGATVTGIDADANAINVARTHAETMGLDITYVCGDAQNHDKTYDIVVALEVIEHVSNPEAFIKTCIDRLKPGGLLILSTLNRTAKSYALGIIAAEYILNWVPRGTHSWQKFLKPSEIAAKARTYNFDVIDVTGLVFNPLKNSFVLSSDDLDVNYLITLKAQS